MELALSRLTAMLERREEAAIRLERLAKEHPARCQPLEALGQLAWRKGELEDARTWFRKAVDLEPDSWNVYWDYARLAHSTDSERPSVIAALRRMLALNQTHLDAKLMLAEELFQGKRYGESVVTYNTITNVDPERAPRLFLGKAYALLRMEHFDPLTRGAGAQVRQTACRRAIGAEHSHVPRTSRGIRKAWHSGRAGADNGR